MKNLESKTLLESLITGVEKGVENVQQVRADNERSAARLKEIGDSFSSIFALNPMSRKDMLPAVVPLIAEQMWLNEWTRHSSERLATALTGLTSATRAMAIMLPDLSHELEPERNVSWWGFMSDAPTAIEGTARVALTEARMVRDRGVFNPPPRAAEPEAWWPLKLKI